MLLSGDTSLIITVGLYDHQMIFCTRKTKKEKVGIHNHQQIFIRSYKEYSVDDYENALGQIIFPTMKNIIIQARHITFFKK